MNNATIKQNAKHRIKGKLGFIWMGTCSFLILSAIQSIYMNATFGSDYYDVMTNVSTIYSEKLVWMSVSNIAFSVISIPLTYGVAIFFLDFIRDKGGSFTTQFSLLKDIGRIFFLNFLQTIIVVVGLILFIIPGVIMAVSYTLVPYIYRDYHEVGILGLLKLSYKMMKGYKVKSILFECSFILWYILSIFTLGFALIWVFPYISSARAIFYNEIIQKYQQQEI